jgi:GT2 family glycosyltransferase
MRQPIRTGTRVDVAVVVVTYNSALEIVPLLQALPAALDGVDANVVVVDNHSTDDTLDRVRRVSRSTNVVALSCNRGYAAGINAGVSAAREHRAVLVLNPDVGLGKGAIPRLLAHLDEPGVGIVAPRIIDAKGDLYPSLRREPTLLRAAGVALVGGRRAGRYEMIGEVVTDPACYDRPTRADWAAGAMMLISAECWRSVGSWDEAFFLFSEETDFALRAKDAGWILRYVPDVVVFHRGGISMSTAPLPYALLARNRVRLYGKRHGRIATAAYRTIAGVHEGLRAVRGGPHHWAALKALLSPRPELVLQPEREVPDDSTGTA